MHQRETTRQRTRGAIILHGPHLDKDQESMGYEEWNVIISMKEIHGGKKSSPGKESTTFGPNSPGRGEVNND